ncbi:MAG: motility protein A [Ilumatobacteraceae bacterium]
MPATLLGLLVALVCVLLGGLTHSVSPVFLVSNVTALLIVLGGALGATMAGFEMSATSRVFKAIKRAVLPPPAIDPATNLALIVRFARKARHEGLLSLESEIGDLDDPFMRKGLQLAIDGGDPDAVAAVLRTDIRTMKARHKVAADWCSSFGIYAPTFGIIGAVIGLIATLGHLDRPEQLGAGIASAFVATFWGVFMANGVMLPLSNKMKRMSTDEVAAKEMVLEGVLAIQGGQNPRVIEETLITYLPPSEADAVRLDTVDV